MKDNATMSLSDYLLMRLQELGIQDIFGVPGDFNLTFLDQIIQHPHIEWVGNCNELNAAYAADGYARIRGAGAVLTTFGVGELSAINGIAGAFAEFVPVVKIVGAPSLSTQTEKSLVHHNFIDRDFTVFSEMYKKVTAYQAILTHKNATEEIDAALRVCWIKKLPVYIQIPSDLVLHKVQRPSKKLDLSYPASDPNTVKEVIERISHLIETAKKPVFLMDLCAIRHPMKTSILKLLAKTGLPFANMNMGKGFIDETHPQFIGSYSGAFTRPEIKNIVEKSDCVISFGAIPSDFNTSGFTTKIDARSTIEIHSDYVKIFQAHYANAYFEKIIPAITKKISKHPYADALPTRKPIAKHTPKAGKITQLSFWKHIEAFLQANDIVVAEVGTSVFGLLEVNLPKKVDFISQVFWSSIGYSVGALLGAAMAAKNRRSLLFVGDGSFQLTAQEISTVIRQQLNAVVFLINNDGYTIERVIHGPTQPYNDIQMWKYKDLPAVFGDNVWTTKVSTETELTQALLELTKHPKKFRLIEIIMDRNDCPDALRKLGALCEKRNAK